MTTTVAQQKWNRGMVTKPGKPAKPGRAIDRPGTCPNPRCGQEYTGRAPRGMTRVAVAGSREPARVYCPPCVEYGRALAEIRALPIGGEAR